MARPLRSFLAHHLARLRMNALRALIRPLVRWNPLAAPREGYSLVLSCAWRLADMPAANLRCIDRLDLTHLDELLIIFDKPADDALRAVADRLVGAFPRLPLRFVYFTPWQTRVTDAIGWGWTYCWLAWCLGLAAASSRFVFIHDLDALPLDRDFFEKRYRLMRQRDLQYLGMQRFQFNGFTAEDNLAASNELMVDARFLRERFKPIDLFASVGVHQGRPVAYDLMLWPQTIAGRTDVLDAEFGQMVHPSQMICQFTALLNQRRYTAPARTTLPLIPYYLFLGDDGDSIRRLTHDLSRCFGRTVSLLGRDLDLSALSLEQAQSLHAMARQVERALHAFERPEVAAYFDQLEQFAGGSSARQAA